MGQLLEVVVELLGFSFLARRESICMHHQECQYCLLEDLSQVRVDLERGKVQLDLLPLGLQHLEVGYWFRSRVLVVEEVGVDIPFMEEVAIEIVVEEAVVSMVEQVVVDLSMAYCCHQEEVVLLQANQSIN